MKRISYALMAAIVVLCAALAHAWLKIQRYPARLHVFQKELAKHHLDNAPSGGVLIVGDSMALRLPASFFMGPVVNCGVSGESTKELRARMARYDTSGRRAVVIISGTNDKRRGIRPDDTVSNLLFCATGSNTFLVEIIPPREQPHAAEVIEVNRKLRRAGVRLIDTSGLATYGLLKKEFDCGDGHLNAAGNRALAEVIRESVHCP